MNRGSNMSYAKREFRRRQREADIVFIDKAFNVIAGAALILCSEAIFFIMLVAL